MSNAFQIIKVHLMISNLDTMNGPGSERQRDVRDVDCAVPAGYGGSAAGVARFEGEVAAAGSGQRPQAHPDQSAADRLAVREPQFSIGSAVVVQPSFVMVTT